MRLTRLSLTNFRNFARLDLELPPGAILLLGSNAQGKTSLLEAVYFLATLTSFQTHADRQLVNFLAARESDPAVARLVGEFQRGSALHRLEARLILEGTGVDGKRLRKEVLVDGVRRSVGEAIGLLTAVLFVPQMSQILEGGPDERRRYLNLVLAQASPAYTRALTDYHEALTQRNALLRQLSERGGDAAQLAFWDERLADLGAQIMQARIHAVAELETPAARAHRRLTRGAEVLRLDYRPSCDPLPRPAGQLPLKLDAPADRTGIPVETIRAELLARLTGAHAEEIARGVTTVGPHRDDLRVLANGVDLGDYGSRGQIRSALLALKLAEVEWLKQRTGQEPVILLDEVMAELDPQRRADLLETLAHSEQMLLTTTDLQLFPPEFAGRARVWQVEAGTVRTEKQGAASL